MHEAILSCHLTCHLKIVRVRKPLMGLGFIECLSAVTLILEGGRGVNSICPFLWHAPVNMFRFMDAGGWSMLNVWVAEAKKVQNKSLLIELLQVSSPGRCHYCNRVQS